MRRIAREADLPSADKKDSQGICFVGKVDLPVFLQQKIAPSEGEVVEVFDAYYGSNRHYLRCLGLLEKARKALDTGAPGSGQDGGESGSRSTAATDTGQRGISDAELDELSTPLDYRDIRFETETYRSGRHHTRKTRYRPNPYGAVIGRHDGAQFYTIGQRKGLAIGGHAQPLFVLATDMERNIVFVGEGESHRGMTRSCLRIARGDIHWIRPQRTMQPGQTRRYRVRIRYRQPLQDATLIMRSEALYILFDTPQRSITPGQFAVWYAPDGEMEGSGVI